MFLCFFFFLLFLPKNDFSIFCNDQKNLKKSLRETDPEVAKIIDGETARQRRGLQLIASEVSKL